MISTRNSETWRVPVASAGTSTAMPSAGASRTVRRENREVAAAGGEERRAEGDARPVERGAVAIDRERLRPGEDDGLLQRHHRDSAGELDVGDAGIGIGLIDRVAKRPLAGVEVVGYEHGTRRGEGRAGGSMTQRKDTRGKHDEQTALHGLLSASRRAHMGAAGGMHVTPAPAPCGRRLGRG